VASCEAITKAGEPCSSGALTGGDRCLAHSSAEVKAAHGFGGPQLGAGRPRNKRLGELLAEAAEEHKDEFVAVFRDAMAPDQPARVRVAAASQWGRLVHREHELQQREREREDDFDQLPRDVLQRIASRGLARATVRVASTCCSARTRGCSRPCRRWRAARRRSSPT
jgi:hypothetical protein